MKKLYYGAEVQKRIELLLPPAAQEKTFDQELGKEVHEKSDSERKDEQ